jgi:peptidoglycan hydrolase-like protein with peptidoglycan-binding domain
VSSDPAESPPPVAASAALLPAPVPSDSPAAASSPPFAGVQTAAVESGATMPEAVHDDRPLGSAEVREVQERLLAFGFNPGPFDGNAGPMTVGAVMHYQQARGGLQTGKIDRALLDALRRDPAPKVVHHPHRHHAYYAAAGPRRSDPFAPLRTAGARFEQWLRSLAR